MYDQHTSIQDITGADQDLSTDIQDTSPTADQDASREDQDTTKDQDTPGDQDTPRDQNTSPTDPSIPPAGQVTTPPTTTCTSGPLMDLAMQNREVPCKNTRKLQMLPSK